MSRWSIDSELEVYLDSVYGSKDWEWHVDLRGEHSWRGRSATRQVAISAMLRAIEEALGI